VFLYSTCEAGVAYNHMVVMKTSDFDYCLPGECIAQKAMEPRDHSRLMVLSRNDESIEHSRFYRIDEYLQSGDLLLCNDSRVIPARLFGRKVGSGARIELLLLRRVEPGLWEALAKPARRLKEGDSTVFGAESTIEATIVRKLDMGVVQLRFSDEDMLEQVGAVPLPPYIHLPLDDAERYQTVYARNKGSVAAPTAGLHFTPELMSRLESKGVRFAFVTLHLALDSFRPVKADSPEDHIIHREYGELSSDVAAEINRASAEGRRVVCVGTSAMRVLEHAVRIGVNGVQPFSGWIDLFILPGHDFRAADAIITNFHLPRSTLLMLVSAFAGRDFVLRAYEEAMSLDYRFYSFGDAMLIH